MKACAAQVVKSNADATKIRRSARILSQQEEDISDLIIGGRQRLPAVGRAEPEVRVAVNPALLEMRNVGCGAHRHTAGVLLGTVVSTGTKPKVSHRLTCG